MRRTENSASSVVGNQNHDIRVYDGEHNYPRSMYFQRGVLKIINVEPRIYSIRLIF